MLIVYWWENIIIINYLGVRDGLSYVKVFVTKFDGLILIFRIYMVDGELSIISCFRIFVLYYVIFIFNK